MPGAARAEPVRILMEPGSYEPRFERSPPAPPAAEAEAPAPSVASNRLAWNGRVIATILFIAAIAVAGAAILAGLGSGMVHSAVGPSREAMPPVVAVRAAELVGAFPDSGAAPKQLVDSIESGLGSIDYIVVRGRDREGAASHGVDYALASRFVHSVADRAEVEISLTHQPDGKVVWSRLVRDFDFDDKASVAALGASATAAIGDISGAVFADIRMRMGESDAPLQGFRCQLAGIEYARERTEEQGVTVRTCLQAEVAAHPDEVPALTLFSTILVLSYLDAPPEGKGLADLKSALALAEHAYDVAPQRANAVMALSYAHFFSKDYETGIQGGLQATAISPFASLIILRTGRMLISRGRYDEGVALLSKLKGSNSGPQAAAVAFLALAAHMQGRTEAEQAEADRIVATFTALGLTMRILNCDRNGDAACVETASQTLRRNFPGFARDVPAALDRYGLTSEIKANLIKGLIAAKFDPASLQ